MVLCKTVRGPGTAACPYGMRSHRASGRQCCMRILYIHPNFSTPRGSWGTRPYDFARRWIQQGHRVTVVTAVYDNSDLRPSGPLWNGLVDGIEVRAINMRLSNHHGFVKRILTFLLLAGFAAWHAVVGPYDVVLVSSGPLPLGIAGLAAHRLRRRPYIFEVRDLFSDGLEQLGIVRNRACIAGLRWFEGVCYRNAARVVALSDTMAEQIRARHGIDDIAVAPNASNVELFERGAPPPAEITTDQSAFVYVGTLGRANDCVQILAAARHLEALDRRDIHIYLIGGGSQRRALAAEAYRDGLDRVHFISPMPKTDLAGWLAAATAMLLTLGPKPVLDTASPNKLFDAFAAGLPVIQTTGGWIRQVLAERDCGITVDGTEPAALADAMLALAGDRPRRDRMGRNARRLAREVYSVDRTAATLLDVLVAARASAPGTPG